VTFSLKKGQGRSAVLPFPPGPALISFRKKKDFGQFFFNKKTKSFKKSLTKVFYIFINSINNSLLKPNPPQGGDGKPRVSFS
jgi:hypothetical protein